LGRATIDCLVHRAHVIRTRHWHARRLIPDQRTSCVDPTGATTQKTGVGLSISGLCPRWRQHRRLGPASTPRRLWGITARDIIAGLDDIVCGYRRGPLPPGGVNSPVLRELAQHCANADMLREQILGQQRAADVRLCGQERVPSL